MPIPIYNSKHVKSLSGTGQQSYKCKYIPIKKQFLYGIPSQDRVNPDSMQKEKKRHPFLSKKLFLRNSVVYRCLRIPVPARAKKICKKVVKKFGGKEKRCTFAIPFGKWGCERGREGFPDGHEKIIDKTGETVQQVPKNKEFESVNSVSGGAVMPCRTRRNETDARKRET